MRFIKRFIFMVILLVIAFFAYRLINPSWATSLLYDLKSFANSSLWTNFSLTEDAQVATGDILIDTGFVIDNSWALEEVSDEELLLGDVDLVDTTIDTVSIVDSWTDVPVTWTIASPTPSTTTTTPKTTVTTPKTTVTPKTTTTSNNWLSSKDIRDMKNLLENFQ